MVWMQKQANAEAESGVWKHLLVLPELHQSVWRQNHKELICKDMKTIYRIKQVYCE